MEVNKKLFLRGHDIDAETTKLVCEAINGGCNIFLTVNEQLLNERDSLELILPIQFLTPLEIRTEIGVWT